ncbi:metallophosphoesterase [Clostridium sp. YIM B02551]|uniref:metallophosphoesterase family protein n=1 Tax=Clostridium sp. YIM B02551 TaxID=2910679 RepID=UPI001EEBD777|nr:metallophosphoesterase family protein [Clostridium sp. YIM B02551]
MKFAIVSDIHGNIKALEAFIKYIDDKSIEKILNLGDILAGEYPKEVFEKVFSDKRFINIRGNHENKLSAYLYEQYGGEIIRELNKLELKKIIDINGKSFLMVHSRETSNTDIPLLYNGESLERFLKDYDDSVDYVLIGHTHLPLMVTSYGEKTIINPGSLGLTIDGYAYFCIGEFTNEEISFNFKKIKV